MKKERKYMGNFKKLVDEHLLKDIPLVFLFEKYNLSKDQIDYLFKRVNEIYGENISNEELNTFYIPPKDRRLNGFNLNYLFQKLETATKTSSEAEIQNIKEEIIIRNFNLVTQSMNCLFMNIDLPKEDTIMCGVEGLLDAIDSYESNSNTHFTALAVSKIVKNIKKHFSELCGITWEEFVKGISIPITSISEKNLDEPIIFGNQIDKNGQMPISFEDYEEIATPKNDNLEKEDEETEERKFINYALSNLTNRERKIIELYYGIKDNKGLTLKQIASQFGVSTSRISFKKIRAILKIRKNILNENNLNSYNEQNIFEIDSKYIKICQLIQAGVNIENFSKFLVMSNTICTEEEIIKIILDINEKINLVKKYGFNIFAIREELANREAFFSLKVMKYIMLNFSSLNLRINDYLNNPVLKK